MHKLIPILALVAVLGCGQATVTKPTAAQLADFSTNAAISLPASAQPIGWSESRGMDNAFWLQVKMPTKDLQTFLENSPFKNAVLETNQYGIYKFERLLPIPPTRYRRGEQELPNARFLNILLDESNDTNVVVYLMWHET
jgi:hypothetical protein